MCTGLPLDMIAEIIVLLRKISFVLLHYFDNSLKRQPLLQTDLKLELKIFNLFINDPSQY